MFIKNRKQSGNKQEKVGKNTGHQQDNFYRIMILSHDCDRTIHECHNLGSMYFKPQHALTVVIWVNNLFMCTATRDLIKCWLVIAVWKARRRWTSGTANWQMEVESIIHIGTGKYPQLLNKKLCCLTHCASSILSR